MRSVAAVRRQDEPGKAPQMAQISARFVEERPPMGDDVELLPRRGADTVIAELQDRGAGAGGQQRRVAHLRGVRIVERGHVQVPQ